MLKFVQLENRNIYQYLNNQFHKPSIPRTFAMSIQDSEAW